MCLQPGVTGGGKVCLVGGMDLSHAGNLWNWNCLITGDCSSLMEQRGSFLLQCEFLGVHFYCDLGN